MKIGTRVKIAAALTICLLLAYGGLTLHLDRAMNNLAQEASKVTEIVRNIAIMRTLAQDYLLYRTERAQRQWATVYAEVLRLLNSPEYRVFRSKYDFGDATNKLKIVGDTFSRLMTIRETAGGDNGGAEVAGELQNRLATQLQLASQDLVTRFFNLNEEIYRQLMATQRLSSFLDILAFLGLGALIISNAVFLQRAVVKPVLKLQAGAEIIGAGNLDHKVGMTGPDEIGQLSRAFDRMTENLKERTADLERINSVLSGINRVFKRALTCGTEEELGLTCLTVAEELTGSRFGFISELNREGRLDTIAFSDLGWDLCRMGANRDPSLLKNLAVRGLFGMVVKDGKPLIANAPASHPGAVGLPEGHPPIAAFLGVPLIYRGETMGLIGLGNKDGGYGRADQEGVEAISLAVVEALKRFRAEEAVKKSEENLRFLTSQILVAQEKERKRISYELHDGLGQSLTVLKLQLRAIQKMMPPTGQEREEFESTLSYVNSMVENVRRVSKALSPALLEDLGLPTGLRDLFEETCQLQGMECAIDTDDIKSLFSVEAQIIIYRICQEILNNIVKHSEATRIELGIKRLSGRVRFSVTDNGNGFHVEQVLAGPVKERGLGLAYMEEQARLLDGTLSIRSQEGAGTSVNITVPFSPGGGGETI
jgi:signal transduction histidine kinase